MLAYRTALWHPTLVTHLFTASVPYPPPRAIWVPLEEIRKAYPVLGYQLQFRSGEVERSVAGEAERVRWFLSALYGGRSKAGGFAFASERGVLLGEEVGGSRLLSLKVRINIRFPEVLCGGFIAALLDANRRLPGTRLLCQPIQQEWSTRST